MHVVILCDRDITPETKSVTVLVFENESDAITYAINHPNYITTVVEVTP